MRLILLERSTSVPFQLLMLLFFRTHLSHLWPGLACGHLPSSRVTKLCSRVSMFGYFDLPWSPTSIHLIDLSSLVPTNRDDATWLSIRRPSPSPYRALPLQSLLPKSVSISLTINFYAFRSYFIFSLLQFHNILELNWRLRTDRRTEDMTDVNSRLSQLRERVTMFLRQPEPHREHSTR